MHLTCGTAGRACGTYGKHFAQRGFGLFLRPRVPAAHCRQALFTPPDTQVSGEERTGLT
jgi:hypothetical protein